MLVYQVTEAQRLAVKQFLPCDASAKRGLAIACRLSVCLCPSLSPSVTLVDCDHI